MPQTVLALAFGCLPELDGQTLLWKTAHTFVTGHGAIKSVVAGKLPTFLPYWTPALKGALWIAAGSKVIDKFTQL